MPDSLLNSWGARVLVGSAVVVVAGMLTLADSLLEPGPHTAAALLLDFTLSLFNVLSILFVIWLVNRVRSIESQTKVLRHSLLVAEEKGREWRTRSRRLMAGLSQAIEQQFTEWGLTPAEAEIAALMLKGLSLREIGGLRATTETTIRQQAQGIYRKSNLANRAELSAYFLEDLFNVVEDDTVAFSGEVQRHKHPI